MEKKIGFIGYGNMGRVLIDGFIFSGVLKPEEIILSTRTKDKLSNLKKNHPEIEIAEDNCTTTSKSNLLFLFVGTKDVKNVLDEINNYTTENTHIVYIAAALSLENVEHIFKGKITKVIPSITSEVLSGVSLVCHNPHVNKNEALRVNTLLNSIGDVKLIQERDFEVGTDITSCSPAFIAKILMEFAKKAASKSGFTREESEEMLVKTLYGTSKLLKDKNIGFEQLIDSVATKGGITEVGLEVLDEELDEVLNKLFEKTNEKRGIIKSELQKQY